MVIAALLIWLSFWAIPAATARAQQIRVEALRDAQFGALEPGRFRTFGGGNVVFYAERVDDNGILHNVNVFVDHTRGAGQRRQAGDLGRDARRAARRRAGRADVRALRRPIATKACRASGEFRVIQFSEGGIPIRLGELNGARQQGGAEAHARAAALVRSGATWPSCSGASRRRSWRWC